MDFKRQNYIRTYTGKYIDVFNFELKDIDILDIAHSLSLICRFGGHIHKFLSVAEHSLWVSKNLPEGLKLPGLLHDAAEAYLSDVPSPIKKKILVYKDVENNILSKIFEKHNLEFPFDEKIEKIDRDALDFEWDNKVINNKIKSMNPETAEKKFLNQYYNLTKA